jgi:hypothetical protein
MEYLAHWVFENWVIEVVLITNRRTSVVPICRHKVTVKCISKITIIFIQTTFLLRKYIIKKKKLKNGSVKGDTNIITNYGREKKDHNLKRKKLKISKYKMYNIKKHRIQHS